MRNEEGKTRINLIEVERIVTPQDTMSIYQVNGRRTEDIEGAVAVLRDSGYAFGMPGIPDPITRAFWKHKPIETPETEGLPVVIFVAGPTMSSN